LRLLSNQKGTKMAKKKTEFDKAVERAAKIVQAELDTLPSEVAKEKRKDFTGWASRLPTPGSILAQWRVCIRRFQAVRPQAVLSIGGQRG
jgi:hypothetical protein